VPECDREATIVRRRWPTGGCCAMVKTNATVRPANADQCMSFGWVATPLPIALILKNLILN